MSYERPQPGNPNQLTVQQHVLPRASIERFCTSGFVQVELVGKNSSFKSPPDNALFCAQRAWDQTSERAYLDIESAFQTLADQVLGDPNIDFSTEQNVLATRFYCLVLARTFSRRSPQPSRAVSGITPAFSLTKDLHEKLEKRGYKALSPNGSIPGRMLEADALQSIKASCEYELSNALWHPRSSPTVPLLVSDSIDKLPYIPISGSVLLSMDSADDFSAEEANEYNQRVRTQSEEYFFWQ